MLLCQEFLSLWLSRLRFERVNTTHFQRKNVVYNLRSVVVTIMTFALIALVPIAVLSQSSTNDAVKQQSSNSSVEQELINLSKQKWLWMSERKVDSLDALLHERLSLFTWAQL